MTVQKFLYGVVSIGICSGLLACGGGGGSSSNSDEDETGADVQSYTIGGTITGHSGAISLSLNGSAESFDAATFVFSAEVDEGDSYTVTVASSPSGQSCTAAMNQGTASSNVTDIAITCVDDATTVTQFSVGGTIVGASGEVTLSLNGVEQSFSSAMFTFDTLLDENAQYSVLFVSSENNDTCAVSNAGGVVTQNISSIEVNCTSAVGGSGRRLSRVERDYDNNGTPELVADYTYTAGGSLVGIASNYTDDGTTDLYQLGNDENLVFFGANLSFDSEGRPDSFSLENTLDDSSLELFLITYSYLNDQIESISSDFTDPSKTIEAVFIPSYVDQQLVGLSAEVEGVTTSYVFNYRVDGSLETAELSFNDVLFSTTEYFWRSDGQIDGIDEILVLGGLNQQYQAHYDSSNRLIRNEHIDSQSPASDNNYTEHVYYDSEGNVDRVEYDVFSDGSIEAVESYEWEAGDCFSMYAPSFGALDFPNSSVGSSSLFPAGVFARVLGCED